MNRLLAKTIAAGSLGLTLLAAPAVALAGNDVVSEVIVPCSAGTCTMGNAGSYTVARAGNRLTITSVSANTGWNCQVQTATGFQTRIECLNGSTKVISQAEVKNGVVVSKVRVKLV